MKKKWSIAIVKHLVGVICLLLIFQSPIIGRWRSDFGALIVQAATFEDINQSSVFIKQLDPSSYSGTCTLASNVMMLRRYSMMRGDSDWSNITESAARSTLWVENVGQRWNYTYKNINVSFQNAAGDKKAQLIKLLSTSPEGVVIYNGIHAVLITDYTGGEFYCADPLPSKPNGRISFSQAYSFNGSVNSASKFCYVVSPPIDLTPSRPTDTTPPSISNIRVTDLNRDGYTVTCDVSDNVGIDRVLFPTWHEGQGGGDAKWLQGSINGNTASVRVNVSDWDNFAGFYLTHVYE